MDIPKKIKHAETHADISEAELARRLGTSPQAFGQRMRTGKFSTEDLVKIGEALGAEFACSFTFPDGTSF